MVSYRDRDTRWGRYLHLAPDPDTGRSSESFLAEKKKSECVWVVSNIMCLRKLESWSLVNWTLNQTMTINHKDTFSLPSATHTQAPLPWKSYVNHQICVLGFCVQSPQVHTSLRKFLWLFWGFTFKAHGHWTDIKSQTILNFDH